MNRSGKSCLTMMTIFSEADTHLQFSNLANTSSLLWHAYKSLHSPSCHVNWAGFYTLNRSQPSTLILGPFHGRPACQSIAIGRGVCGTAAAHKRIVRVKDVREFPGHIACDGDSRSEIVVPILGKGGEVSRYRYEGLAVLIWAGRCDYRC